uniref:Uncharacterized protein n=1 Tax=Pavo cristatus TaxID=9049 RepID=A0A8C9F3L0_PAVCR
MQYKCMLLFCHTLVGAFLPLFLLSGNWVSAKNINFYNVRPPLDRNCICCLGSGCWVQCLECVSCCEGMICNVEIPTNHTNAVFAVLHARRTSDGSRRTVSTALLVSVMAIALS